ncbi:pyrroline-5-carboxylate reductase [Desulfosporosinus metallidurans]|uniref:Pyrroline-5-carboxylate reductase n=1 Tax=Desulfosporosinus metallidurans TaxID=1888891 RepID=A0A1Q8QZL7_9FIRM|nr:pyrroline-5-carboxylate reductase [Desulfosporosinus metallidurans]OLN32755.1 Pyrroline-5-carboxylate reductase [Desulfosporosinus metallidurans]
MNQSIGFIGGGNLAEAVIGGLRKTDTDRQIRVTNRTNHERIQRLVDTYNIMATQMQELVDASSVLIIAVKPKDVQDVLKTLKNYRLDDKLIISVAAGIPLEVFSKHLPDVAVVRAMPNTSTAVLHSMTGLVRGENVLEEQAAIAERIFSSIGQTLWIPEEKMNALIALSGSGPAYFYLFTESLIQAGVQLGLSEAEAERLARETLVGAGKMLTESGKSPGKLREEVTSPNGTTYAALSVFKEEKFPQIVVKAVQACAQRAEDMEGEYSK